MDFTEKYTSDSEERLLLRRINDLIKRSQREYRVLYSAFLTPAEQSLVMRVDEFLGSVGFEGGYEEAERRVCRVCTAEYQPDDGAPLTLFCAVPGTADADISHRDVLGSLMGLGIRRDMVGDIIVSDKGALFFCHESIAGYISTNLEKIGRYSVRLQAGSIDSIPEPQLKKCIVNVSSMRIDSVCAEGFRMSRTKAQELIRRGLVSVNWQICESVSRELSEGDRLSARGFGKLKVGAVTGTSKKGRLFAEIYKYE